MITCWVAGYQPMAVAQFESSGFFMIVPVSKNCEHRLYSLRGDKSYCVAPEPIISIHQIESVRRVGSADKWVVDIRFTQEGLAIKTRIANALPAATFLLVVDDKAVALFDTEGRCISPITYDDLKWVERHLANLIKK